MRRALSAVFALASCAAEAQIYTRTNGNGVVEATNVPDQGFRLTYPGKGTLIHSRSFRGVYNGEYDHHILAAANTWGVSPVLVRAVIQAESAFDRNAVSSKGAQGLMQLMPFTARRFGVLDPFDARQNIFGGVQYLKLLLDMFGGDVSLALASFNAGENAVVRFAGIPPYKETQNYVRKIQGLLASGGPQYRSRSSLSAATTPASSYAPDVPRSARKSAAAKAEPVAPARPRVYYRFVDGRGVVSVSHDPPPEGVTYTLIRALDY